VEKKWSAWEGVYEGVSSRDEPDIFKEEGETLTHGNSPIRVENKKEGIDSTADGAVTSPAQ